MRRSIGLLAWLAAFLGWAVPAAPDTFVYPRRPTQTNLHTARFDWRHIDLFVEPGAAWEAGWQQGPRLHLAPSPAGIVPLAYWDWAEQGGPMPPRAATRPAAAAASPAAPSPVPPPGAPAANAVTARAQSVAAHIRLGEGAGGVRLYFYEAERAVAERAAVLIEQAYRELVDEFAYVPSRTFPLVLYSTYLEFLQTNLFPVQEGVLGITSPIGLEITLPFLGDPVEFRHVAKHELVHQFTIQKVRDLAPKRAGLLALQRMPLWFIEGLAEHYSCGWDHESEMLVRDIVLNPASRRGYVIERFFDERPWDALWTYKVGQARVAFLDAEYGEGTVQRILARAGALVVDDETSGLSFDELVAQVTGDDAEIVTQKFLAWIRRRAYQTDLRADPSAASWRRPALDDDPQALAASPDGELLLYRTINRDAQRVELHLVGRRSPGAPRVVARDRRPGVESLSPLSGRNFDIGATSLAFAATSRGRDTIYWRPLHRAGSHTDDVTLGEQERFDLRETGIVAIDALALSPTDSRTLAVIGVDELGRKDLFVLALGDRGDVGVTRLTRDWHAERGLDWGRDAIVYGSSRTATGHVNLFRQDPADGTPPQQISDEARHHRDPVITRDGHVVFVAYDDVGANLYAVTPDGLRPLTAVSTGLFDPQPGPDPSTFWALQLRGGQRELVAIEARGGELLPPAPAGAASSPLPRADLNAATPYQPWRPRNWELGPLFALLGVSNQGIYGEAFATAFDQLRDHGVLFQFAALGDFERLDASFFYTNQARRVLWSAGVFHALSLRYDEVVDAEREDIASSWERYYGVGGVVRLPFDRFRYAQAGLSVGGMTPFLLRALEKDTSPEFLARWEAARGGHRLQTEASLSLGTNTTRLHPLTGPIGGASALLEGTLTARPVEGVVFGAVRLDAEQYLPIAGATNVLLRGGAGHALGSDAREFWLSTFDTLRGIPFNLLPYVLGRAYFFSTAELQVPLSALVRIAFIDVEGIVGADFGGIGASVAALWDHRVLDFVTGLNFGVGPLVFRLHFARPVAIGAPLPVDRWVTNLSLGYRSGYAY